ncbi:zinc finger BED domain-containing protein RICESLEEPER 2-like [Senna tora]|uniref:Zinc finger BED domain-containing protein RICESLEEPER 2-like n=1 Tax=Senna tora TaxID=362788 RepID=A0A835C7U7_9FABA|nr:zinc finger BED domain-containing protein RICESLEEPER 2-like [Senna tora]
MRCCAHSLNLVANDGLKDLHNSIFAIRNVFRYVRSSPTRLQRFKDFVQKEKIDCKAPVCLDILTRWYSTYLMLEHALKFQKVFDRMEDDDDGYNAYFWDDTQWLRPLMMYDWNNANVFVQFLKVFYTITLRFFGSLYVTCNSYFHDFAHVHTMLQASAVHHDPIIGEMAKNMKLKWNVFRSSLSPRMSEALICTQNWLSPTKFNFNDHDFDQYEEFDNIASDVYGESTITEDVMK